MRRVEGPEPPVRGWMKFERGTAPALVRETELTIRRVDAREARHFGRIVASAFGMTPEAGPALAAMVDDERWRLFVSFDGEHAAGAGALFIHDGAAWFEWGATEPAYRRRGSQGAIMTARINAALEAGCDVMFTETGEAVDGDPQHSYGNIERFGFEAAILRKNWSPPMAES